jgi:hypothetical protein
VRLKKEFITGQNEREETTQNTTVTKSAACASYKIKAKKGLHTCENYCLT